MRRLTYHVDAVITGVEGEQIVANQISLLVEPLHLEYVAFFLYLLHFCFTFVFVE